MLSFKEWLKQNVSETEKQKPITGDQNSEKTRQTYINKNGKIIDRQTGSNIKI